MVIVEFIPKRLYGGGRLDDKGWSIIRERRVNVILNVNDKRDMPPSDSNQSLMIYKPLNNDYPPSFRWIPETIQQLNQMFNTGHSIYIHDNAGRNRLGFVLTAFYMQRFGLRRDEALRLLREKKPDLKPNKRYMARLAEYEAFLSGQKRV